MSRIVVGVDDSEGSRQALRWAVNEASLRGATLDVIYTFQPDHLAGLESANGAERVAEVLNAAGAAAQALVDSMLSFDGAEANGRAIESYNPAQTLVEQSKDADMLVVGSRGRGSFKSLLLGSVSQQCAQHAECPVVIIRTKPESSA